MKKCPKCGSEDIHRSGTKSRWESWRRGITGKRPYRCRACRWRGWAHDTGPTFDEQTRAIAERALIPDPPNLQGTQLARGIEDRAEVDLAALDILDFPGGGGDKAHKSRLRPRPDAEPR